MFSYIVTGVIFVYNDIIVIFTCAFAIFGVYSVIREVFAVLGRRFKMVAAIYISENTNLKSIESMVEYAELCICDHTFLEAQPILVTDCVNAEFLKDLKYTVYVKYTEDIWPCRVKQ